MILFADTVKSVSLHLCLYISVDNVVEQSPTGRRIGGWTSGSPGSCADVSMSKTVAPSMSALPLAC